MPTALLKRRLLTTNDYDAMIRSGILAEDERVELIEGEIVEMTPIGGRHARCVMRLDRVLQELFSTAQASIWVQSPFHLSDLSEPVPDIMLATPARESGEELPESGDVKLIIEVSDSSLRSDRAVKLPLYAAAGIPEVWIVNLNDQCVEVSRTPRNESPAGYRETSKVGLDGNVAPLAFPETSIRVADFLV